MSFAYEEAVLEIRELLSGGKIPWEKSLEQWQCKFLQNVGSFTEEKTVQEGFSYKEYLQILLFFLSDTTMNYRSMDILENKYQIHMDTMLQASTMRFQYYGKPLFWNFNFLKEKNWSIFQFPVEVSFSYCK